MNLMETKMTWKADIVRSMRPLLDNEQLAALQQVLEQSLEKVCMSPMEPDGERQRRENAELLKLFLAAKRIEGCSEKTLHYYEITLAHLVARLVKPLQQIATADIRSYLSQYQKERDTGKVTMDNLRRIFSTFFAWLEDEDYIPKNPVRRIHRVRTEQQVRETISDEQLECLRDACSHPRDVAIIDLLVSTGMRIGELVQLNRKDIDFHERQCVVHGKGDKERVVYFNARTKIHLQCYLDGRTDTNPALFVSFSAPHNRLCANSIGLRLRQLGQRAHITKVHPHKFRRTMATMAIDKGMPIEQVQRLLGHTKIDTTLHYAMVNQANVKSAHRKFLS